MAFQSPSRAFYVRGALPVLVHLSYYFLVRVASSTSNVERMVIHHRELMQ